jgi:pimeloyl-ACP methyl ester carboxylesterase
VIAPDLRGFGGSSRTAPLGGHVAATPARSIDDHAADVVSLMDALDVDRAVVGGLSMGGYVTFGVWRLAPERVQGLVLCDTRAEGDTGEARANRARLKELVLREGSRAAADTMLPKLLGASTRRDRPALERDVERWIEGNDREAIADALECLMSRPDSTPLLTGIDRPVQLIVGAEDELTPPALHDRMQALLPDAAMTTIEAAGHLSNLEQPDVFNRTLSRFLATVPA